jgi:hypothetical protein
VLKPVEPKIALKLAAESKELVDKLLNLYARKPDGGSNEGSSQASGDESLGSLEDGASSA